MLRLLVLTHTLHIKAVLVEHIGLFITIRRHEVVREMRWEAIGGIRLR